MNYYRLFMDKIYNFFRIKEKTNIDNISYDEEQPDNKHNSYDGKAQTCVHEEISQEDILPENDLEYSEETYSSNNIHNPSNIIPGTHAYDLLHLSEHDTEYVDDCIKESESYPIELQAIKLAELAYPVICAPRSILHRYIILKYENSPLPFDMLATALAYNNSSSLERKNAIKYFEKYFIAISKLPPDHYVFKTRTTFPLEQIYDIYATLCEKEYMFDRAYLYRQKRIELIGYMDLIDSVGIGRILQKTDINRCVEFYQSCVSTQRNPEDRLRFKNLYDDALKKQSRNYHYRPRPHKPTDWELIARKMEIEGAMIFINKHHDIL